MAAPRSGQAAGCLNPCFAHFFIGLSAIIMRRGLGPPWLIVPCGLAIVAASMPAWAADAPTCRELERRFDLVKAGITSTQLSLALFAASDGGCVPLARRLIDAGASLEARDRLGALPLARAARAAHVALVEP